MTEAVDQPSQARLLKAAVSAGIARVQTTLPGIVVSYDATKCVANIQPAVHEGTEPWPVLDSVPVEWPSFGAAFRIVGELVPGNQVELSFSKLDHGRFLTTGVPSQADIVRPNGMYATARPVALSDAFRAALVPVSGGLAIGTPGVQLVCTATGIAIGTAAADAPLVRGTELAAWVTAMLVYLVALQAWIATAGPVGAPPVPPVIPPTLLSTIAKVT